MPFDNLSGNHYLPEEMKKVRDLLQEITQILEPRFGNLSAEERQKYSSIGEYNKLIVGKVKDYYDNQPELSCDEVDWTEFMNDYNDRAFLSATIAVMERAIQGMDNTRILHDADNYNAALRDYEYAQYKNNGQDARFEVKMQELKQFFNRSGTKNDAEKGIDTKKSDSTSET